MNIPLKYEDVVAKLDAALAREAALQALSVTRIMLDVVPGEDGMGEEIYAKSVADVEALLSKQCEDIEALQDREAALRESLTDKRDEYNKLGDRYDDLQQRLTVAEQREANLLGTLVGVYQSCLLAGTKETLALAQCIESATEKDALKPAAEGEGS